VEHPRKARCGRWRCSRRSRGRWSSPPLRLLALFHGDAQGFADALVGRLHLNPAEEHPAGVPAAAGECFQFPALGRWPGLPRFTRACVSVRGVWPVARPALGQGGSRRLSGGIYVPVEIYELTRGVSWIKVAAVILNAVVGRIHVLCAMDLQAAGCRRRPDASALSSCGVRLKAVGADMARRQALHVPVDICIHL